MRPVTALLIGLCLAVSLVSGMGSNRTVLDALFIAEPGTPLLANILAGQVWRVATPMFIHFGVLHLLFNMIWMWDLGNRLEARQGSGFLVLFVLFLGSLANLAQYFVTANPLFGGMSGVIYGLLGYVWVRGTSPRYGLRLYTSTVVTMLVWFVLCWVGLLGPVANWAHSAGLACGVAWGYIDRWRARGVA